VRPAAKPIFHISRGERFFSVADTRLFGKDSISTERINQRCDKVKAAFTPSIIRSICHHIDNDDFEQKDLKNPNEKSDLMLPSKSSLTERFDNRHEINRPLVSITQQFSFFIT
jgi:hypothetical protein